MKYGVMVMTVVSNGHADEEEEEEEEDDGDHGEPDGTSFPLLPLLMAMMMTITVEVMAKKMVMPTADGTTLLRPGV